MKSKVFTIPRGNPGEADKEPEDSMQAELEAPRRSKDDSSFSGHP